MKNITAVLMAACFSTGSALALEMTSPDIRQGEPMQQKQVFDGFGCSGENLSPELTWRDVPEGT
ncbi:MAG: phosphatidylethanolamine-binding protein, partial [Ketobacter sp.]